MTRSTPSRTSSLKRLNLRWSTLTSNSLRIGRTCRMLILLTMSPSSLMRPRRAMSMEYVSGVSPSSPQTMLIPGRSRGIPFGPWEPPMRLIMRTASST